MNALPPLVLVTGAPGAGKSTLAGLLGEFLKLPVLSRDALKEAMADFTRFETLAESERFGLASVGVFYSAAKTLLRAGTGAILDTNFRRGVSDPELLPLLEISRAVQVHCAVPPEENSRRYIARHERGERHPAHFDAERIARVQSGERKVDWSAYEPLEIGIPTLRVDTQSGHKPLLTEILAFVKREAMGVAQPTTPEYPKKHMGSGALFFNAAGDLLMVKPTYRDYWSIPGGVVEERESPHAGCVREVREELGLTVPIGRMLLLDYMSPAGDIRESLQFFFDGGVLDSTTIEQISVPPAELSGYRFAPLEEVMAVVNPRIARRLPHALQALREGTTAYLEDGTPLLAPTPA
jgi:8-oxo-dGTP diphosphatase